MYRRNVNDNNKMYLNGNKIIKKYIENNNDYEDLIYVLKICSIYLNFSTIFLKIGYIF